MASLMVGRMVLRIAEMMMAVIMMAVRIEALKASVMAVHMKASQIVVPKATMTVKSRVFYTAKKMAALMASRTFIAITVMLSAVIMAATAAARAVYQKAAE